ncbi:uncharacterized protein BDR25DRAFT_268920 [Lindgomyces ingoldianus]|uniref:Uncharacterized protein n=1 Tax=Lindgomyces ingoldianus TaxID=673940 RepID=A0ACB6QJT5_9PLEO|nr:uncharacterized protein BDR25DRAFT_268920 [Lindgomyces ingoldianus]KAF2466400.1 hypothetical protein BDR25DRAFT_268920 [Lindgomyces ingoldianus]
MSSEACCTCASLLSSILPRYDEKIEKSTHHEHRFECCGRVVCAHCVAGNPRFATYCPYCQVSIVASALPQGLRDPPTYSPPTHNQARHSSISKEANDELPPYSTNNPLQTQPEKPKGQDEEQAPDVLHFVDPNNDSIASLSLRYGVPAGALRGTNGLYADHLLAARRTLLIPGEYYKGGVSLSPRPLEGEEEEIRKGKVRKWMVACKVPDIAPRHRYDVALLYLQQADYDLNQAVNTYKTDERWEQEHPLETAKKGKLKATQGTRRRRWGFGGSRAGLTGQLL